MTPFCTDYNLTTDFSYVPVFDSFPRLSAIPPFTQVNLAIAGEGDRQVPVRTDFWAWLTSMALVDFYKFLRTC
jgi:hypothetical protein